MRFLLLVLLLVVCLGAFAQTDSSEKPTAVLYGYYKKGQNFKNLHPRIEEYEALIAHSRYTFLRTNIVSDSDYKLIFSQKYDNGKLLQVRLHYQFLIPYFKISMEEIRLIFPGGDAMQITLNSEKEMVRKLFHRMYDTFVMTLIKLIDPAKTITKEQLEEALKNPDKVPGSNNR